MEVVEAIDRALGQAFNWVLTLGGLLRGYMVVVVLFALMALFGFGSVLVWREYLTHRSLTTQRRRYYLVRATGRNDWSMEELERWAAQLSMIRRRVRRYMDRPAHALRFRLETTPQGGTRYTVEGSWRIERIMNNPVLRDIEIIRIRPRNRRGNPELSPDMPESP